MKLPKISISAIKRCGNKVVYEVGKHSPALLVVAGGALAIASVVGFVKATREMDEELTELEARKEAWDDYDAKMDEAKEREHEAAIIEANTGKSVDVEYPVSPNCEPVTTKEVIVVYAKNYALPVLLFAGAILCVGGAYIILNKRIMALGAALGTAIAERDAILQKLEAEYGEEAVDRVTSPTKVVAKAQGQRRPVYGYDDANAEALDCLCVMYHSCEDFWKDAPDLNIRQLHEINEEIYDYFKEHDVLTLNMLKGRFLKYKGNLTAAGNVNGWTRMGKELVDNNGNVKIIGRWTGLRFDDKGILMTDPDTGEAYTDIEVRFPKYMQVNYC